VKGEDWVTRTGCGEQEVVGRRKDPQVVKMSLLAVNKREWICDM
jgi:hypothetical protein